MLNITTRQRYLKHLGLYSGEIDGIEGAKTKSAYLALQKKYFTRKQDIDGIYGNDTDKLLQCAYNVDTCCKNFELEEFKCQCGGKYCTGYPDVLSKNLLKNLQKVRDRFGATNISSGMRCSRHNANEGGVSNSKHKYGKAADIYNATSRTESGRKTIMAYWRTLPNNNYTYCNIGGNYPNMGTAVHVDVE